MIPTVLRARLSPSERRPPESKLPRSRAPYQLHEAPSSERRIPFGFHPKPDPCNPLLSLSLARCSRQRKLSRVGTPDAVRGLRFHDYQGHAAGSARQQISVGKDNMRTDFCAVAHLDVETTLSFALGERCRE